jgi:hypothetical protein
MNAGLRPAYWALAFIIVGLYFMLDGADMPDVPVFFRIAGGIMFLIVAAGCGMFAWEERA